MTKKLEMDLRNFWRLVFEEIEETLVRNPCDGDVRDKKGVN